MNSIKLIVYCCFAFIFSFALSTKSNAQCSGNWTPLDSIDFGTAGTNGPVWSINMPAQITAYNFATNGDNATSNGNCSITNDPSDAQNSDGRWHKGPNHTLNDPKGYFMVSNSQYQGGDWNGPEKYMFYIKRSVCPNTDYRFSYWGMNISNEYTTSFCQPGGGTEPCDVSIGVFRSPIYQNILYQSPITKFAMYNIGSQVWKQQSFVFNSGNDTSLCIALYFRDIPISQTGCGSDFGIDDIKIEACVALPLTASVTPTPFGCTSLGSAEAKVTGQGYSYSWSTNPPQTTQVATGLSVGTYSVVISSSGIKANGTCSKMQDTFSTTVTSVVAPVPATYTTTNTSATIIPSGGNGPYSYLWSSTGGTDSTATNLTDGSYTCYITDRNGCFDSVLVIIENEITVPNVFTPNNDGVNDEWFIKSNGVKDFHVEIYNRWGIKIWSTDSDTTKWNGRTLSGTPLPDGTYYYLFTGQVSSKQEEQKLVRRGYLTLLSGKE